MDGEGNFYWTDGRIYVGNYSGDKKNGHGVFYWADGGRYEGVWMDGKQVSLFFV